MLALLLEVLTILPVVTPLLCKILETHDLSLDYNKIVEAWREHQISVFLLPFKITSIYLTPKDFAAACDEMPTPRAIKERIIKIKAMASNAVLEDQTKTTGEAGPSTPKPKRTRKPKASPQTPKSPKSAPDAESVTGSSKPGPSKKRKRTRRPKVKEEPAVEKTPDPSKSENGDVDDESRADLEEEISEKLKVEEENDSKEDDLA
ncbi:hypothetical protein N7493_005428 [Penicillium malachiteum]|uniref:Uncharacterized protein n=1 Tax=Penicillium malachiteum TaxID=1324776 RepID=A0AAD6HMM2_9EURO|nr:hypothetical protein N7493_005428 [Penicillium malachiteum]